MQVVYVAMGAEDRIAVYASAEDPHGLTHILDVPCSSPLALCTDPDARLLFVATQKSQEIVSFAIHPRTGTLSDLDRIPSAASDSGDADFACFLSTDRTGRWLFSAYHSSGHAAVHEILPDGKISRRPHQYITTTPGCHCIQSTHDNEFVFVTCAGGPIPELSEKRTGQPAGNRIFMYHFNARTGCLIPNGEFRPPTPDSLRILKRPGAGGAMSIGESSSGTIRALESIQPPERNRFDNRNERGPRHFCLHPNLRMLYTTDEQSNTVTAYAIGRDGRLTAVQSEDMLPLSFQQHASAGEIAIDPGGGFLLAGNRVVGPKGTRQTVACFSIERSSGRLSTRRACATQHMPQGLGLSNDGARLFAVGTNGNVGMLSICGVMHTEGVDARSPRFERLRVLHALEVGSDGGNPVAVLPVDLGGTPSRL